MMILPLLQMMILHLPIPLAMGIMRLQFPFTTADMEVVAISTADTLDTAAMADIAAMEEPTTVPEFTQFGVKQPQNLTIAKICS